MNKLEAAKLLTIASGFDRFVRADEVTATAWSLALANVDYPLAEKAVVAHYSGDNAHKQLMPADIIKTVEREARLSRPLVIEDVRAAKARQLVPKSWPRDRLLPADVRERLFAMRRADLELMVANGALEQIAPHEFREMAARIGGGE